MKADQQVQVNFIQNCLRKGVRLSWVSEYLECENIYKINPPESANRM